MTAEPGAPYDAGMIRHALHAVALVVALAATAADADDFIFNRKEAKQHPNVTWIRADLVRFKDGKLTYSLPHPPPSNPSPGDTLSRAEDFVPLTTEAFVMLSSLDRVKFDGVNDWLTVKMKNGDVIRGVADSLTPNTLRLKGVEKVVRMLAVKEIVATEPPAGPRPE